MTWTRAALCRTLTGLLAMWLSACVAEVPAPSKCTELNCDENETPVRCACPDVYQPVCGTDGKTYGNACKAACVKAPIASKGECTSEPAPDPACICPAIYAPVCGTNGKTYGNACEAGCAKVPVASEGACPSPGCICPAIYKPVCGTNGKTYGNACEAGCAKVPVASEGACPDGGSAALCKSSADCTKGNVCYPPTHECRPECTIACLVYEPVCGTDGKTYGCGKADAHCHGVEVASPGECPDGGSAALCKSNADCTKGNVCYPPTHECQLECTIACLVYDPVCGTDGKTYGCGKADAHCHGVEVASPGECAPSGGCACTKEYAPVCGSDGKTYSNACMAKCAGAGVAHAGACGASGGCVYEGKQYKVGASFPASDGCNSCSCTAGGQVACTLKACLCDYSAPDCTWAAKSPEQCKLVKFACPTGKRPFFNNCGCGCEPDALQCKVGGCSGQLCVGPGDPDVSTCEWREEYACYKTASCAVQADGRCGWTQTDELRKCIEVAR